MGGHCIPIDPNYLSYEVRRKLGVPFRFVELAEEVNRSMPSYVVDRLQESLNRQMKPLNGTKVLLLGVTYKKDIADQRESPAIPVAEILLERGAVISFHDPKVDQWTVGAKTLERTTDILTAVAEADAVLLLQNHESYVLDEIEASARLLLDTRGVTTSEGAERL